MSKKLYPEEDIQNIANAIRTLNGSSDSYTVSEMASAIELPENAYYLKSASGNPINITDGEELKCQSALVTFAPKQSGTGDPSPSNIRPISGWDGLELTSTGGKNLFDKTAITDASWLSTTTGEVETSASTTNYVVSDFIPVFANQTVYIPSSGSARRWFYDSKRNPITYLNNSGNQTYTPSNSGYIRITINKTQISLDTYQVEYGSTATDYEPYQGETYTATFPDAIPGGQYDFVSGKLMVTHFIETFDGSADESWSKAGASGNDLRYYIGLSNSMKSGTDGISNYLIYSSTSRGEWGTYNANGGNLIVKDRSANFESLSAFKTYLSNNPLQFCYELTTPIEITLTPEEIELLKGSNTVWTDGDTVELEYWSKSNTVPLLNMLSMGTMNISNINNENNGNEVEETPVEESKESLEEIENIDNSENE